MIFGRRKPQTTTTTVAQHLAVVRDAVRVRGIGRGPLAARGTDVPPVKDWSATAARRFANDLPGIVPCDRTVGSFVSWWTGLGMTADIDQDDLRDEYEVICAIAGYEPVSIIDFGRELLKSGCQRSQADRRRRGKRWRPYVISFRPLPTGAEAETDSVVPLPVRLEGLAPSARPKLRHHWSQGTLGRQDKSPLTASHITKGQGNGALRNSNRGEVKSIAA